LVIALTALKRGFDAHGVRLGRLSGQVGRPRTPQRALQGWRLLLLNDFGSW